MCNYFSISKFYNNKNGNAIPFLLKKINILIEIVICEWWACYKCFPNLILKKKTLYINTDMV
jgi:hypothetical protein